MSSRFRQILRVLKCNIIISYIMGTCTLPNKYALSPQASGIHTVHCKWFKVENFMVCKIKLIH